MVWYARRVASRGGGEVIKKKSMNEEQRGTEPIGHGGRKGGVGGAGMRRSYETNLLPFDSHKTTNTESNKPMTQTET